MFKGVHKELFPPHRRDLGIGGCIQGLERRVQRMPQPLGTEQGHRVVRGAAQQRVYDVTQGAEGERGAVQGGHAAQQLERPAGQRAGLQAGRVSSATA